MKTRPRTFLLSLVLGALALIHVFPVTKHLRLFATELSWDEAWRGFGALGAVVLVLGLALAPKTIRARVGNAMLRNPVRRVIVLGLLAWAHTFPVREHVPRMLASWDWSDAWRGLGATLAVLWFVAPRSFHARALRFLGSSIGRSEVPGATRIPVRAGAITSGLAAIAVVSIGSSDVLAIDAKRPSPSGFIVPRAKQPITIDGELHEGAWVKTATRTGGFRDARGEPARPFSEARFLRSDSTLYLALYAADEDIRVAKAPADGPLWTGDAFQLLFRSDDGTERSVDVAPNGTVTDGIRRSDGTFDYSWQSGAKTGVDMDGTPNDPSDQDEEWIVEMGIPLRALGLKGTAGERIQLRIRRCDDVHGERRCGAWGDAAGTGTLILE
jgi:hypothetical protein